MQKVAAALVKAQTAFGPALKTKSNPHLKAKYADLAACVEAVVDALNSNGIMLMQHTHDCDDGVIVETVFLHESGEMISSGRLHVPASKRDPQGYGSSLTYARRYSLMAACGIAPEDDDGNAGSRSTNRKDSGFDVTEAMNAVESAANLQALEAVWKREGAKAIAAGEKGGHAALKDAVKERKAQLEGQQ